MAASFEQELTRALEDELRTQGMIADSTDDVERFVRYILNTSL